MCDVWSCHDGMGADAFFSSDAASIENVEEDGTAAEEPEEIAVAPDSNVPDADGVQVASQTSGWRQQTGKRNREKAAAADGMKAIGAGLNNIAEAFKIARTQNDEGPNREILSSLREMTETLKAQTQAVNTLLQHLIRKSNNTVV